MTVSSPIQEWILFNYARSYVERETMDRQNSEGALIEAIKTKSVRTRRRRYHKDLLGARDEDLEAFGDVVELADGFWDLISSFGDLPDSDGDYFEDYQINFIDVREWLNPTKKAREGNKGGRPKDWSEAEFWIMAVLLANTLDGLPDTQAGFVSAISNKYISKYDRQPGETWLKERASLLYHARKVGN